MPRFSAVLVPGTKPPYHTWTFLVVPAHITLRPGPVRGTLNGSPFRGSLARADGTLRIAVTRALQAEAGVSRGARVTVTMEPDVEPRRVNVPVELQALFDDDPDLARDFEAMAPSHRRAWAAYVGGAVRPETRRNRASKAIDGIRARAFPR